MKMKRITLLLLSLLLIVSLFSGCNWDPYSGKRPYDYGDAKWICEDPLVWFEVDTEDEEFYEPGGEATVDGEIMPVELVFVHQTKTVFISRYIDPDAGLTAEEYANRESLEGECLFFPEALVVRVNKERDTLFGGKYDELTFIRKGE